ncbi:uncharacterized protein LAESUDRAFT_764026 [Laetiporus sulphureus 93-53]|uniref:Uncharacterized protein n=1 Tax=Laetiporus sulphureus 93-53 TaxID=1314785 RepID=A0A165BI32_9APHY|nr:uncharacterized protein LAESUDRAFT_764026 [Laetiporus sulphureus 93-53]KZT01102.1 hypothetical protein LAESUDRAFT_764026 [Laetiporus sulphureus 93-53]
MDTDYVEENILLPQVEDGLQGIQLIRDKLIEAIQPLLELLWQQTGTSAALIVGAPPQEGSNTFFIKILQSGKTQDASSHSWSQCEADAFHDHIIPSFTRFLAKTKPDACTVAMDASTPHADAPSEGVPQPQSQPVHSLGVVTANTSGTGDISTRQATAAGGAGLTSSLGSDIGESEVASDVDELTEEIDELVDDDKEASNTIQRITTGIPDWAREAHDFMMSKHLGIENGYSFKTAIRGLDAINRPPQVAHWLHVHRRMLSKLPVIESLDEYTHSWWLWWASLQPEWRKNDISGHPILGGGGD